MRFYGYLINKYKVLLRLIGVLLGLAINLRNLLDLPRGMAEQEEGAAGVKEQGITCAGSRP
jgi:hypothetical protein